jgi:hypothetical protein
VHARLLIDSCSLLHMCVYELRLRMPAFTRPFDSRSRRMLFPRSLPCSYSRRIWRCHVMPKPWDHQRRIDSSQQAAPFLYTSNWNGRPAFGHVAPMRRQRRQHDHHVSLTGTWVLSFIRFATKCAVNRDDESNIFPPRHPLSFIIYIVPM